MPVESPSQPQATLTKNRIDAVVAERTAYLHALRL